MNKLQSTRITELSQVEVMRHIYNDNLDMLATRPIPRRTKKEQQEWWLENNHILKAFLYNPIDQVDKSIAFLVLTDRGLFDTPIIAIVKEAWGSGYGQEIVRDYIVKANRPLAGSQLQSNTAICHINKKVGWLVVGQREESTGIVDLLYHPGVNDSIENSEEIYRAVLLYHKVLK